MSDELYKLIPGLRAAHEKERSDWDAAWLGINESICGIDVKPFTARHDLILGWNGARSPFLGGPLPTNGPELSIAIGTFLWVVSPAYGSSSSRKLMFLRGVRRLDVKKAVTQIRNYVAAAYADAPGSGDSNDQQFYSWFATAAALFGAEFGWTRDDVIDMPLRQMFQLLKVISRRKNPTCILFKPSDALVGAWLNIQNAAIKKAAQNV